ncbi:zinc finger, C2H2 type [Opisthorchis viverrini]|uniref:Zinc finger, C2H2 type n=1 Tax=Opisthorchis viverrini TaxID=6198 RepID=A0A1S8WVV4_OPIVI|nr:zinc finger, C2H2 type [Opisthorchis viverrini]
MDPALKSKYRVTDSLPAPEDVLRPDSKFPSHACQTKHESLSSVKVVSPTEVIRLYENQLAYYGRESSDDYASTSEEQDLFDPVGETTHDSQAQPGLAKLYCCIHPGCGYILDNMTSFRNHVATHTKRLSATNFPKSEKSHFRSHQLDLYNAGREFKCEHPGCGRTFQTDHHLRLHQVVHGTASPVQCDYPGCFRRFLSSPGMMRHKEVHHGVIQPRQRLTCTYPGCGRTFASGNSLRQHHNVHSKERVYLCDYPGCEYQSLYQNSLDRHKETHKNKQDRLQYRCRYPTCTVAYVCKSMVEVHERCSKGFTTWAKRSRHHGVHRRRLEKEVISTVRKFNSHLSSVSITLEPVTESEFPESLAGLCPTFV